MNGPGKNHDPKLEGAGKLIGGYAPGNLTDAEEKALFEAALHDQEVFNAMMDEQALKDLLDEPGAKRELIDALQPQVTLVSRIKQWLATPIAWGAAGALATAALLFMVIAPRANRDEPLKQVAQASQPALRYETPSPAPTPESVGPRVQADPLPPVQTAQSTPAPEPRVDVAAPPQRAVEKKEQAAAEQDRREIKQASPPPPAATPLQAAAPPAAPKPAVVGGTAASAPLSVDYILLRRGSPGGAFVPAGAVSASDELRLQATATASGVLSLYQRQDDGSLAPVASLNVTAGQPVQLPQDGVLPPGRRNFLLSMQTGISVGSTSVPTGAGFAAPAFRAKARMAQQSAPGVPGQQGSVADAFAAPKKATVPAAGTNRATAEPGARSLAVEITIR